MHLICSSRVCRPTACRVAQGSGVHAPTPLCLPKESPQGGEGHRRRDAGAHTCVHRETEPGCGRSAQSFVCSGWRPREKASRNSSSASEEQIIPTCPILLFKMFQKGGKKATHREDLPHENSGVTRPVKKLSAVR